jgi:hypothetical protein
VPRLIGSHSDIRRLNCAMWEVAGAGYQLVTLVREVNLIQYWNTPNANFAERSIPKLFVKVFT